MVTRSNGFDLRELAVSSQIRGALFKISNSHTFRNPSKVTRQACFHGEAKSHLTKITDRYGVDSADMIKDLVSFLKDDDATSFCKLLYVGRNALEVRRSSCCKF
ncbi:hypothetical protein D3C72_2103600 [compost metagenome]